ncbi:AAA family ATPase [Dokdonella sp.]|uniref:McrB family protein n=1 Tax=Dokdonella sp. TaxID=2291710 RepID=UPI0025BDF8B5|nr:AAA family ATPase [Dokdonella sp.]MBX3693438.1 AAA family ATPase [Dokdonella sp.]
MQSTKQGGYQGGQKGWTPNYRSTFKLVPPHDLPEFESTLLKPFFGTDLAELAALAGEPIEAASLGDGAAPPQVATPGTGNKRNATCFNRIYYGPPGTGKTYTLMQLLKRDYETQASSVSIEEWRTQIIAERIAALTWWEAVAAALYDLGKRASVSQLLEHRFVKAVAARSSSRNIRAAVWANLQSHTVEESKTVKYKRRTAPAIFDKQNDSIWHLEGDWQDACADLISLVDQLKAGQQDTATVQRYSFVTFHQSYGYEEFVEGLRPVLNGDAEAGEVEYEIRPGAFKELCRRARQAPDQRFAMVIDEINRGNISKIFGELITLIEPDKRDPQDGSKPPIELTLAYSGERFSVPANVDIIGTMNTADRSLALLDTALRRRFDFVSLLPDTRAVKVPDEPHSAPLAGLVVTTDAGEIDVRRMLERINERIEALYDRDHCIGHAYFTHLWSTTDGAQRFGALADTFRNRVLPLLEEYFFEDWRKIRLVLGDNQKPDAAQFITESDAHEQALNDLFGDDHGLDSYTTQRRHQPQPSAFANPAAYLGIYQSLA